MPYTVKCSRDHHGLSPARASFDKCPHHNDEFCTLITSIKTHHCDERSPLYKSSHGAIFICKSFEKVFALARNMAIGLRT